MTEGGQVTFTVTRSGDTPAETVYFSTLSDGTATYAEGDYTTTSGGQPLNIAVNFSSGETSDSVTLNIVSDGVADSGEQFRAIVQRNSSDPATTYLDRSAYVMVNDTSGTAYSMTPATATVNETVGNVSFTITRSGAFPAETLYVSTAQTEGYSNVGDYTGKLNESLSFSLGQSSKTVAVAITNDTVVEGDETFGLIIQRNASDLASSYLTKSTFTIASDDTVTVDDFASSVGTIGSVATGAAAYGTINWVGDTDWFQTTLTAGTTYEFDLKGQATDSGSLADPFLRLRDSAGSPVPYAFADDGGTGFNSKFTYTPLEDGTFYLAAGSGYHQDGIGTYTLTQTAPTSASGTSYSLTPQLPTIGESAAPLTFTVKRVGDLPAETVFASTVYGTQNGYSDNTDDSDYVGLKNVALDFLSGQTSKTFEIAINDDALAEGNETFGVLLQAAEDDPLNTWLARSRFTILDDELGTTNYRISPLDPAANEAAGTIDITVTRSAGLGAETIYVSTGSSPGGPTNSNDYVELNNLALSFGSNEQQKTFAISLLADSSSETPETFNFSLWRTTNHDANSLILRGPLTIFDDSSAGQYTNTDALFLEHGGKLSALTDLMLLAYSIKDSPKDDVSTNISAYGLTPVSLDSSGALAESIYSNGVFDYVNASAFVARSSDAIFISFAGTDELLDKVDWTYRAEHYAKFSELIEAVDRYAADASNGIHHIYLTGHSLGASMAQAYMAEHGENTGNLDYEAIVFANPGYGESLNGIGFGLNQSDVRMSNILIVGDVITLPDFLSPVRGDKYVVATKLTEQDAASGLKGFDLHKKVWYSDVGHALQEANPNFPLQAFAQDPEAQNILISSPYVDATSDPFKVVSPSTVDVDVTFQIIQDSFGSATGTFAIAGSTPLTIDMGSGHLYAQTPISATNVVLGSGAVVVGSLIGLGRELQNVVVVAGVAVSNGLTAVSKGLTIVGTGAANFIRGLFDDQIYAGGGDDVIDIGVGDGDDTYDGGEGIDTLTYASTSLGIAVDLLAISHNATGVEIGVDQISSIENVVGGSGADSLRGTSGNNTLMGGAGADKLYGSDGSDVLNGGVDGDGIYGEGGNDHLAYTAGMDTLDGGAGGDTADFSAFASAVSVNLGYAGIEAWTRGQTNLDSGTWRTIADLLSVEHVTGSAYADRLTGDAGNNIFSGGDGNDRLSYTGGMDTLDGGSGGDTADFSAFTSAVSVDLGYVGTEAWTRGQTNLDSGTWRTIADLMSIEHITGTAYADRLTGDVGNNLLSGGNGNDRLSYTAGLDTLNGGAGGDTADFSAFGSAVSVNLGYAGYEASTRDQPNLDSGTWRTTADLVSVENVTGSAYADRLTGDTGNNQLLGGAGNDRLSYTGGLDTLDGAAGIDTADFSAFGAAVSVNLAYAGYEASTRDQPNLDSGTWRTIADLNSVENLTGSAYADRLTGNPGSNQLEGGAGNDALTGADGADTLVGGAGHDTLTGGTGADRFDFTAALSASTNVDRITDYSLTDDLIRLDNDVFTAFVTENVALDPSAFYSGPGIATAHDVDDRIIYNTSTGNLYYDPDGTGGTGPTLFATLTGAPAANAEEFFVVA